MVLNFSMELSKKNCQACDAKTPPLTPSEVSDFLKELKLTWELDNNRKISAKFVFQDFKTAMKFVNKVAKISEKQGHHTNIKIFYNKVIIELTTHVIGGLSENDFVLASKIELLV